MTCTHRWLAAAALAFGLISSPAEAQYFGGGFWGEGMGVGTVQGDVLRGEAMYAMGMGRYNLETAQANSIDADTMKRWNEYIYQSRLESGRRYRARLIQQAERTVANIQAARTRLRTAPNQVDISSGNALNLAMEELNDPKVFSKAVYYGSRVKLGGESIRDIPFKYASEAISISVQQLVNGPPPLSLRGDEFKADLAALQATISELRTQSEELGEDKPETIQKAKELILAIRAKADATLGRTTQPFRDADRYLKALHGLASMLETPAVNLLLAGVENRPEATLGDLLLFMSEYNLRFGASTNSRQRQVYLTLFPMLAKLRTDVIPTAAPEPAEVAISPEVAHSPEVVFDGLGYKNAETKAPVKPVGK